MLVHLALIIFDKLRLTEDKVIPSKTELEKSQL